MLNAVEIPFMLNFNLTFISKECGSRARLYDGVVYCLMLAISLLIAWQFQAFFRQVTNFVRDGTLPCESSKRRNSVIIVCTWLLFFSDLVIYIGINRYYSAQGDFITLSYYNLI